MDKLTWILAGIVVFMLAAFVVLKAIGPHEDKSIRLIQTPDGQIQTEAEYFSRYEVILRNRQTGEYLREDGSRRAPESNRDEEYTDRGPCGPMGIRGEDRYPGVEAPKGEQGYQ